MADPDSAKAVEAAYVVARVLASYPLGSPVSAAAISDAVNVADAPLLIGFLGAMVAELAKDEATATGRDVDEILRDVINR